MSGLGSFGMTGMAGAAAQQHTQNKASHIEPVPAAPLLASIGSRLHSGHELVHRLENIADRIFGAGPTPNFGQDEPDISAAATINTMLNGLMERLSMVANRLEQL